MVFLNTWNYSWRQTCSIWPKDKSPFITQTFRQSAKSRRYTKGQLTEFWDAILLSSASKNVVQKFTRNLILPTNANKGPDGCTYDVSPTHFFVDNMISPNYFENEFVPTFRTVGYWLGKCGIWFSIFPFIKLIFDIVVTVMRTVEIHRITGRIVSFGKLLLTATNVQFLHAFNTELSLFSSQTHQVFDTYICRKAGIYRTHLSLYSNTTQNCS